MDSVDILFKNFLSNKHVYVLNQYYWEKQIDRVLSDKKIKQSNWYNNQFANGAKIYDGNPIFSLVLSPEKAVRIIQENPESNSLEIAAWVQEIEYVKNDPLKELVISLELSKQTKDIAIKLVKRWLENATDVFIMEKIIDETLDNLRITEKA